MSVDPAMGDRLVRVVWIAVRHVRDQVRRKRGGLMVGVLEDVHQAGDRHRVNLRGRESPDLADRKDHPEREGREDLALQFRGLLEGDSDDAEQLGCHQSDLTADWDQVVIHGRPLPHNGVPISGRAGTVPTLESQEAYPPARSTALAGYAPAGSPCVGVGRTMGSRKAPRQLQPISAVTITTMHSDPKR